MKSPSVARRNADRAAGAEQLRAALVAMAGRVDPRKDLLLEAGPGSAPASLLATVAPPRALVVVDDADQLASTIQDLRALAAPGQRVEALPGPHDLEGATLPLRWADSVQRLGALERLSRAGPVWVVATLAAALAPVATPAALRSLTSRLVTGEDVDRDELLDSLVERGYRRQDTVTSPGEFAVRGGILDLYPPGEGAPVRVEYWGDEVESLRHFDPATQRSTTDVKSVLVGPAWELPARSTLRALADGDELPESVEELARDFLAGEAADGADRILPHTGSHAGSVLDHLGPGAVLASVMSGTEAARAGARCATEEAPSPFAALVERAGDRPRWDLGGAGVLGLREPVDLGLRSSSAYSGDIPRFVEDVRKWTIGGEAVAVTLVEPGRLARTKEILDEAGLDVLAAPGSPILPGRATLLPVDLAQGFRLPEQGFHLVTGADLWSRRALKSSRRDEPDRGVRFSDFTEMEEGGLVVHVDHGIGKFLGVKPMLVDGMRQDFLEMEYAKGDKLFVPTSQLDRVQRFIGVEGGHGPKVNRLNSGRWSQTRSKVRADVEEVAKQLLELYAKREQAVGVQFSPDSVWQRELEASFPYEDTRDQARAATDVKRDMERHRPMDRLVCGDVGFGKTEVAVRAVFKAVQDGYQAAVLCPTTVLAQQHFQTFSQRLAEFPVRVAAVSRLRDPKEVRATLKKVKRGEIDVLVGTHRLLSKDVAFPKLGLLVIDEEQRFGVKHKERIKELKTSVDVLTLTATPIPRTLNLALSGARDISTIVTPPRGRLPVKTFVQPSDSEVVRGSIEKELARGGQVFYVHNRIETLGKVAGWLQRLVPEARVRGGHAQMDRHTLENLMLDFNEGAFDVLVSTTIIENGLDIPNVNTILVEKAHRLGLSQLYQLRGRVGRTTRQAYCYLLVPPRQEISEIAYRRLKAMEEHTDLGSGFRVAMRDLELRGAGSILGVEQHGYVNAVGFELYTRLLKEAVARLGGHPEDAPREPTVLELPLQAYLPEDYIPSDEGRLQAYRALAEILDMDELEDYRRELADRYGPVPGALDGLFDMVRLKIRATDLGVASIKQKGTMLEVKMKDGHPVPEEVVRRLMRRHPRRIRFLPDGFTLTGQGWPREKIFAVAEGFLAGLEAAARAHAEEAEG